MEQEHVQLLLRMDERLQSVTQQLHAMHTEMDKFVSQSNDMNTRLRIIESRNGHAVDDLKGRVDAMALRLTVLEDHQQDWLHRAKAIGDVVIKAAGTILVGYILYRLHWPMPG